MEADRVNFGRNVPRHLVEENPIQMGLHQKTEVLSTLFVTQQRDDTRTLTHSHTQQHTYQHTNARHLHTHNAGVAHLIAPVLYTR